MSFKALKSSREFTRVRITVDVNSSFVLHVRKPTYDELTEDYGLNVVSGLPFSEQVTALTNQLNMRLACVVGWDEVEDEDGNPVKYSLPALKSLFVQDPAVFNATNFNLGRFFVGTVEEGEEFDLSEKPEAPPADKSTETPILP